jgi:hypothetical protein
MIDLPRESHPAHPMGALFVGGDWACAEGQLGTLAYVADLLSRCVAEPLRIELVALVRTCHDRPEGAAREWMRVRALAQRALREPVVDCAPH